VSGTPLAEALAALGGGDPSRTWWYLSRAAGLCAYVLLTLDVALGLAVRTRRLEPWLARWRAFDLHRFTALLLVAVAALHVLALLGDRYIGFSLPQLLVPFASPYRPLWTALGGLAFYLLLAIVASFFVRRAIGQRTWRRLHYLTFAVFVLALLHGLLAGTDATTGWGAALFLITGGTVGALAWWRFRRAQNPDALAPARPRPARRPAPVPTPSFSPAPTRSPAAPAPEPLWLSVAGRPRGSPDAPRDRA
jgi:hypothetical protein